MLFGTLASDWELWASFHPFSNFFLGELSFRIFKEISSFSYVVEMEAYIHSPPLDEWWDHMQPVMQGKFLFSIYQLPSARIKDACSKAISFLVLVISNVGSLGQGCNLLCIMYVAIRTYRVLKLSVVCIIASKYFPMIRSAWWGPQWILQTLFFLFWLIERKILLKYTFCGEGVLFPLI